MTFTVETEQNYKISFLDINIILEQGKFITSANRKRIFSGVCTIFMAFYLIPTKPALFTL